MIERYWEGVLNCLKSGLMIGFLEEREQFEPGGEGGARGYRSTKNLIVMAYLLAGKPNFGLPT